MTDKKKQEKEKQLSEKELKDLSGGTINKQGTNLGGCGG